MTNNLIEKNILERINKLKGFAEEKVSSNETITVDECAEKLGYMSYINAYKICISIIKDEFSRGCN